MDALVEDQLTRTREYDVVIKCHQPGPGTREAIAEGRVQNIFTHRDPRDAAASALRVGIVQSIDQIVAILESHQSTYLAYLDGPTLCVPYAEAASGDVRGVERIARYLGFSPEPDALSSLAETLGMEPTRRRASMLTDEDLEERYPHERGTLLHRNHVTNGATGSWREELTPAQARRIERTLAPFFAGFGYDR